MQKKAFTMIELVFVIVLLGILASLAMPRLDRDLKQEAADNILSAIRYTQHLALVDDKHMFNDPKWQQRWWKIMFNTCSDGTLFYRIGSDDSTGGNGMFTQLEAALDPENSLAMWMSNAGNCDNTTISPNILIGRKYGVTLTANTCNANIPTAHVGFDHLGRPHQGYGASTQPDHDSYIDSTAGDTCTFTFTMADGADTFQINIAPETGYATIVGLLGS